MASNSLLIKQAIKNYELGELSHAAKICLGLVKADANNYEALHILGVVFHKAGLNEQAANILKQALALVGPQASILHDYGLTLKDTGDFGAARVAFREAVKLSPNQIDSWYNLGEIELHENRLTEAIADFEEVLKRDPDNFGARINLGIAFRRKDQPEDARSYLQEIIKIDPKNVAAQNNIGIIETDLGNLSAAKIAFQTALSVEPNYSDAHYNLGNVYWMQMLYEFAAEHFESAFNLDRNNQAAYYQFALCLQKLKAYEEALNIINKLVVNCGEGSEEKARFLNGRANIYRDLGRFNEALDDIKVTLAISPKNPKFLGNKALTLLHAGYLEDAITDYKEAKYLDPYDEEVKSNLAHALLLGGYFEEGWREFESRLSAQVTISKQSGMPGAIWNGEDLEDKHLLVWCEQGLGDTIQFLRFIKLVAISAKKISLLCPNRLKSLLETFDDTITVLDQSNTATDIDFNTPLMSLPYLLGIKEIYDPGPYLSARDNLVTQWGNVFGYLDKPRIGIAWQGNPAYEADHQRSIPLNRLRPLLLTKNYKFVSLQQGFGCEQVNEFASDIIVLGKNVDEFAAFTDTAAIISNLDLVITSDTAIAHLAGALGAKVWVLLPATPDWRWLLNCDDSPWYSNMRLFRQKETGDWEGVVAQVALALSGLDFDL